jgi:hypothetical protein
MTARIVNIIAKIGALSLLAVLLCASSGVGKPEDLAQKSAQEWLALVDSGKYAESWDEASQFFQSAVTKDQWQGMLHSVRDPLGKVVSRKLKSANYTKTLPGVPDGDYVVIQYDTSFAHKQSATETITPLLDKNGQWRVSGYFIK